MKLPYHICITKFNKHYLIKSEVYEYYKEEITNADDLKLTFFV